MNVRRGNGRSLTWQIAVSGVTIASPGGTNLIRNLSFDISGSGGSQKKEGAGNILICGAKGVGKTAVFRALRGLWPITTGAVTATADNSIFFLPQAQYCVLGQSLAY